MQHRKIANVLKIAGWIATLGIIFVFYCMPIHFYFQFRLMDELLGRKRLLMLILPSAAVGLPYLAALRDYFSICRNIGNERSFCDENVALLRRIARLFVVDGGIWCIILPVYALLLGVELRYIRYIFSFMNCACVLLFIMADSALALLAYMVSRLLARAEELQNENELTI